MNDRRSSRRTPTILEGRIWIDNHASHMECTVRNVSETGAHIWFPHFVKLPSEFTLEIPRRDQSDRVRLMWSRAKSHGVKFIPHTKTSPADSDPRIQEVLDAARGQLAQIIGVSAEAVRLKLDIDPQ